jgi:hypothetical protein
VLLLFSSFDFLVLFVSGVPVFSLIFYMFCILQVVGVAMREMCFLFVLPPSVFDWYHVVGLSLSFSDDLPGCRGSLSSMSSLSLLLFCW